MINTPFITIPHATGLVIGDIVRGRKRRPYGCIMFTGEVGSGKTLGAIEYVERRKKLFNVPVNVMSNIGYEGQTGRVESVQDILDAPSNTIFIIDEAPTLFNSRNWKNFPIEMFTALVQNRKHGKMFLLTAQEYDHSDKNFRDLTNWVVECYGVQDRWFYQYWFKKRDFKKVKDSADDEFVATKIRKRYSFVGTDYLRSRYDTYEIVRALKKASEQSGQVISLDDLELRMRAKLSPPSPAGAGPQG